MRAYVWKEKIFSQVIDETFLSSTFRDLLRHDWSFVWKAVTAASPGFPAWCREALLFHLTQRFGPAGVPYLGHWSLSRQELGAVPSSGPSGPQQVCVTTGLPSWRGVVICILNSLFTKSRVLISVWLKLFVESVILGIRGGFRYCIDTRKKDLVRQSVEKVGNAHTLYIGAPTLPYSTDSAVQIAMHEDWQMWAHNVIFLYLLLREKSRHELVLFGSVFLLSWWVTHLLRGSQLTSPLWQLIVLGPWAKTTLAAAAAAGRAVPGAVNGHPLLFAESGGRGEESVLFIHLLFNPDWHRYVKACPSHAALQAVAIFRSSTRLQSSVDKLLRVCLNCREIHSLTAQQGGTWGCHMGSHSCPTYLRRK